MYVQTYGFPTGYFVIRNLSTNRVLDVKGDQIEDGTEIILWEETEKSLVEKNEEISVNFQSDPSYRHDSDAWKTRSYLLTSLPLRKPKTIIDDAALFISSAISAPLSFLSGTKPTPHATPDEVFKGPIDLDENEVVEEDRSEEAEVDDSPETGRKVRMVVVSDKRQSDKALGEKARNRRPMLLFQFTSLTLQLLLASSVCSRQSVLTEDTKTSTWVSKYGAQYDQPFSGPLSFAHLPYTRCLHDEETSFDIALLGLPFDTSVTYRPGARFGPFAIRSGSRRIRPDGGYTITWNSDPFLQGARILDCGDVPVSQFDNALAMDQIEVAYSTLLDRPLENLRKHWRDPTRALSKDDRSHPRIVR
ncbi:hypothetical protein H0H93_005725 [Arthromyces matolae]|nr:hypothetical protein H0H93_005725 [Arthromyces matolae]